MSKHVAFLDAVHPILMERLEKAGWICDRREKITRKQILEGALTDYSGLIVRARIRLDQELLKALPHLQFIARSGAGLENIDLDYASDRSIQVFNSPEGNADAVGEHALGQLLMLYHKLRVADRSVRDSLWEREIHRGMELSEKTVAIIGFGHMGRSFARKLKGLNCQVVAYDKYKTGFKGQENVQEWSMEEIWSKADVVSLHLPLTAETQHLVQHDWLRKFHRPITLINTARGGIVRTADLLAALESKHLRGAALDVLEFEHSSLQGLSQRPKELDQLFGHDQVVLSPHVAGWTEESYFKLSNVLADKIIRWKPAI
jgi:D-3-phosphoglycerate dehydrogenase